MLFISNFSYKTKFKEWEWDLWELLPTVLYIFPIFPK